MLDLLLQAASLVIVVLLGVTLRAGAILVQTLVGALGVRRTRDGVRMFMITPALVLGGVILPLAVLEPAVPATRIAQTLLLLGLWMAEAVWLVIALSSARIGQPRTLLAMLGLACTGVLLVYFTPADHFLTLFGVQGWLLPALLGALILVMYYLLLARVQRLLPAHPRGWR